ncbi:MAG: GNAT family N-acetyltransferase [Burkholderiaceae bacterium]|nr:GNAT family N-acetyltransferase [Burkholderiaceae bacterium]
MALELRLARPDDAARIAALARWVWLDSYASDGVSEAFAGYLRREFDEQALRRAIDLSPHWLVQEGEMLQGWAQLDAGAECPALLPAGIEQAVELHRLYIAPPCVGRGLGVRLLRQVRQQWPQRALWLSAWEGNEGALRFYRREGAQLWGEAWFELDGQRHRNEVLGWPALETGDESSHEQEQYR